jgi:hypothetical protein
MSIIDNDDSESKKKLDEIMYAPISDEEKRIVLRKITSTQTPWSAKDIRREIVIMRFQKIREDELKESQRSKKWGFLNFFGFKKKTK